MKLSTLAKNIYFSIFVAFSLVSCGEPATVVAPSPTPQQQTLTISGAPTLAKLVSDIAKRYQVAHPEVKIDIQETDSWRGMIDTRQGRIDIGLVNRELKADEQDLSEFPIAKDGIALILHKDNPVKSLTNQQVVEIYQNKLNNWQKVGGKNAPIVVVSRTEGRASLDFFVDYFKIQKNTLNADILLDTNNESIQAVIDNKNAISYSALSVAEQRRSQGTPIKLLPINGITASVTNVRNNTFPISRVLNLVTKKPPSTLAKNFIDFAQSPEGQEVVKQNNAVPLSP